MSGQTANQPGKTDEDLKHWFAGFFDGEGTIFVGKTTYKTGWVNYSPKISVNNTDVPTLPIVEAALKVFDLPYHVQWSEHRRSSKHAPRWMVNIAGWKRCLRAAQTLFEYLHTKRTQCEDMLELCHLRLAQDRPLPYGRHPHTPRQLELISHLRGRHTHWN